jgi:hypothetical protein
MTKINSKNSLSPLRHFIEQLVDVFMKLPRKNNLDHESLRLLIWWLKSKTGFHPTTIHKGKMEIDERQRRKQIA